MKRSLLYLLFILLPLEPVASQVLKGVVFDSKTKESVINANVYLEGTSYFTITDADGRFELSVSKRVNTRLVISHVAYQPFTADKPYEELPEVILLDEKDNRINEIVVQGDKQVFTRKQMMRAFKDQFLGNTRAGRSCIIQNEDDISFYYDRRNKILKAFCKQPIVIENKYLGYVVSVELQAFEAEFNSGSLHNETLKRVLYLGSTSYQDISKGNLAMQKRRKEAYRGSQREFFRLLINNQLKGSSYAIPSVAPEKLFIVEDAQTKDSKTVHFDPKYAGFQDASFPWANPSSIVITVFYKRFSTYIEFKTDSYTFDFYGNVDGDVRNIAFSGDMSKQRMGDTLPLNYEP